MSASQRLVTPWTRSKEGGTERARRECCLHVEGDRPNEQECIGVMTRSIRTMAHLRGRPSNPLLLAGSGYPAPPTTSDVPQPVNADLVACPRRQAV